MEPSRKKSCRQCRLAKTRCSLDTPCCSRCERRKLPCKYENRARNFNKPPGNGSLFHSWPVTTNRTLSDHEAPKVSPIEPVQNVVAGGVEPLSSMPEPLDFRLSPILDLGDDFAVGMDWNGTGGHWPSLDLQETEGSSAERDQVRIVDILEQDLRDSTTWFEFASRSPALNAAENTEFLSKVSLAMNRSSNVVQASWQALREIRDRAPNLLSRSHEAKLSSLLIGNHLWATIESFAVRFGDGILPPFIHNSYGAGDRQGCDIMFADLPEPLANCSTIIPMYLKRTSGSNALVLKTILLEVQRLYDEFRKYDERTLLHALQALSMYVIMAAADKERCKLIAIVVRIAMGEMATQAHANGYLCIGEAHGNFPNWEDWIHAESKRRTLTVLHIMAKLVDVNMGIPPPPGCSQLDSVPLPSSKRLWEAKTRVEWESEYKNYLSTRKGAGLLLTKSLRESTKSEVESMGSDIVEELSRWSESVDRLGSLLLMALSGLEFN